MISWFMIANESEELKRFNEMNEITFLYEQKQITKHVRRL